RHHGGTAVVGAITHRYSYGAIRHEPHEPLRGECGEGRLGPRRRGRSRTRIRTPLNPTLHDIEAVRAARSTVRWVGDPALSWSVLLHAKLDSLADPADVGERLGGMGAHYPHPGPPPAGHTPARADWAAAGGRGRP